MQVKRFFFALSLAATLIPVQAKDVTIVVTNNERVQRQELVEVSASEVYRQLGVTANTPFGVKNALPLLYTSPL